MRALFRRRIPSGPWRIGPVRAASAGGIQRVTMRVAGSDVWFESADVTPARAPEGVAGALLVPAEHRGVVIEIEEPVDATWLSNVLARKRLHAGWWNLPPSDPPRCRVRAVEASPRAPGTALFFTGGVDSFWTLLRGPAAEALLYVHGFDVEVQDAPRRARVEHLIRTVAARTGRRALVLATNLRRHPAFRAVSWTRSHGAALGGAALFLANDLGTAMLSGSDGDGVNSPWGSHPETDPLGSSSRVEIVPFGGVNHNDKLRVIARDALVRQWLRVCWENRADTLNCGVCEKCLRTMSLLDALGALDDVVTFPKDRATMAASIDRLRPIQNRWVQQYWADSKGAAGAEFPSGSVVVRAAIDRLLDRSGWDSIAFERLKRGGASAPA